MSEAVLTTRMALTVCVVLLALTGATVGVALVDLGPFNPVVALLIAAVKAGLITLYFMHARWSGALTWLVILAGLLWLALLLGGTLDDLLTRDWVPFASLRGDSLSPRRHGGASAAREALARSRRTVIPPRMRSGMPHADRSAMVNPRNFRDEPVCPICARTFKPGDAATRADGCMVHLDCFEEADRREDPCTPVA